MGFDGVVVTDALDMNAVDQSAVPMAARGAIDSGVDLLLAGPAQADRRGELAAIIAGLRSLPAALDAARRVEQLREWLGEAAMPDLGQVGCEAHASLAGELAARSVALLRDRSALIPLGVEEGSAPLVITPAPADLTPADTSSQVTIRLADALARRHRGTRSLVTPIDPDDAAIAAAVEAAAGSDPVVLGTIDAFRHHGQRALARAHGVAGHPGMLVAMRMPTDADAIPEVGTATACWSIHDPSTEAAAAVLCGERPATGRVPLRTGVELAA
jgi:beta-N-acetylhexosaminidase